MTLRKKTLLAIAVTIALSTLALLSLATAVLQQGLREAEEQSTRAALDNAQSVLHQKLDDLNDACADWSAWDDAYRFVRDRNDEFIRSNLGEDSLKTMHLRAIVFLGGRGETVWATGFDGKARTPIPLGLKKHLVPGDELLQHSLKMPGKSGIILTEIGALMVATRPILKSDNTGPVRGTLVVARALDGIQAERIGKALGGYVRFYAHGTKNLPNNFAIAAQELHDKAVYVRRLDDQTVAGYSEIRDFYDEPGLLMRVAIPRDLYIQSQDNIRTLLGTILIAGLVFALATLMLLERTVLSPIGRLSADVHHIGASGDTAARLQGEGSDELGRLAASINDMLANLEVLRRERERASDDLRRARDEAEDANRSKSQFLANMSHELRTPLNAIIGYSEMLQEEAEELERDAFTPDLKKIQTAGQHLLALINDILDLSKIEAGKMDLFLEDFDALSMLKDVEHTILPLAEKNGNAVHTLFDPNLGEIRADLTKVRQILFNLLSNACKFTEKGDVTIQAVRDAGEKGDSVIFRITDTGIGLSPEQQKRLFKNFSQADASTTRKYGGTGLGLVITRRFCEMMGGEISVESEFGEGTTFTVRLPARVAEPKGSTAKPKQADVAHERRAPASVVAGTPGQDHGGPAHGDTSSVPLILCIDDDPTMHELIQRYLAGEGFRVAAASSGAEGLQMARALRPNAITLDVMMPGMDGWAVLSQLKADAETSNIPVVMLTVLQDRSIGYALGVSDYLTKPIERSRLVAVLDKVRQVGASDVLLVEDDPDTRSMIRRMLEKEGCGVREAANGKLALEELERGGPPGLILLDLMMPEMDGFSVVDALRVHPQWNTIPIVIVTAKDLDESDRARLEGGVQHVLQKGSYGREELLARVKQLVEKSVAQGRH